MSSFLSDQPESNSGPVTLPLDRERPPVSSFLRETASIAIPWSYDGSSSMEVTLLAALNAAVYRHTGSTDVPIGLLIDTGIVVLQTQLSSETSVQELMRQISSFIEKASPSPESLPFQIAFRFSDSSRYADELARCDIVF